MIQVILHSLEFILIILIAYLFIHYNRSKKKINTDNLDDSVKMYLYAKHILDISRGDFVALFKYKYENNFIKSHFIFSVDKHNNIDHELLSGDMPVTMNNFSISIFKSHDKTLHELYNGQSKDSESYREIFKHTYKVYFQNLFSRDNDDPIGYITISYNKEYKLTNSEIHKIMNIIKKIKHIIL